MNVDTLSINITTNTQSSEAQIRKLQSELNALRKSADSGARGARGVGTEVQKAGHQASKSASSFSKLGSRIGRIAFSRAIRAALMAIVKGVKEAVDSLYEFSKAQDSAFSKTMDNYKSDVDYLKNNVGTALEGILISAYPLIRELIDTLVDGLEYVSAFTAAMANSPTYKVAARRQLEYKTATEETAKAQKELNKQLMSFDELNVISTPKQTEAMGDTAEQIEYITKNVDDLLGHSTISIANWVGDLDWYEILGIAAIASLLKTAISKAIGSAFAGASSSAVVASGVGSFASYIGIVISGIVIGILGEELGAARLWGEELEDIQEKMQEGYYKELNPQNIDDYEIEIATSWGMNGVELGDVQEREISAYVEEYFSELRKQGKKFNTKDFYTFLVGKNVGTISAMRFANNFYEQLIESSKAKSVEWQSEMITQMEYTEAVAMTSLDETSQRLANAFLSSYIMSVDWGNGGYASAKEIEEGFVGYGIEASAAKTAAKVVSDWLNLNWRGAGIKTGADLGNGFSEGFENAVMSNIEGISREIQYRANNNGAYDVVVDTWNRSGSATMKSLFGFANGGFPEVGSLFVAGETVGQTEIIGNINGRTGVASGQEITGIADAVYVTGEEEASLLRELISVLRSKNFSVSPSPELGSAVRRALNLYEGAIG